MNAVFFLTIALGQIYIEPICPPPPIYNPPIYNPPIYIEPQVYTRIILVPGEIVESKYQEWVEYKDGLYEKVTIINGMAPSIRVRYDQYNNKWITYDYREQIDIRDCHVRPKKKRSIPQETKYEEDRIDKPRIPTNNDYNSDIPKKILKSVPDLGPKSNLKRPSEIER